MSVARPEGLAQIAALHIWTEEAVRVDRQVPSEARLSADAERVRCAAASRCPAVEMWQIDREVHLGPL